ncbi:hypothetical protein SKAU_G00233790 [Synaphobranchus kaupii]|uniref:Gypsy retrotransposon integrase-like protein 1 n=1 Tax=Synaphobranchus kaupii TaxID=118154 RepID=A0A9Q1F678_SYNKA|nr:hypothetical protein SKAU_G00233790 [Synaphobranchus kaupii]
MFVAALRKLAEHCEFNDVLNLSLRDRLVCGLKSAGTQKCLLTESALTLEKAIEVSVSMELAAREAQQLSGGGKLHKVSTDEKEAQGRCYGCDRTGHSRADCWTKDVECRNCGRIGHIERVCRSKRTNNNPRRDNQKQKPRFQKRQSVHSVQPGDTNVIAKPNSSSDEADVCILSVKGGPGGYWESPLLEGRPVRMEIDTGAAVSLVSSTVYKETLQHLPLQPTSLKLKTYTGETVPTKGVIYVNVQVNGQTAKLPLYVVEGNLTSLLGCSWLEELKLDWATVHRLATGRIESRLTTVLHKHAEVFKEELGTMRDITVKLNIKSDSRPKFLRARQVPYAIKPKVEAELESLVKSGVLEPVSRSEWATPIVPVIKKDNSVRICGDFKVSINPVLEAEHYPLLRIEDLFAGLAGGQKFSKIDLSQAYLQMQVDVKSRELLTIVSHKGLYRSKCEFFQSSVEYLGHVIDSEGLHKAPSKTKAIMEAPAPQNVSQLRSYLGLLNYYGKFIPNLSSQLRPLHQLLCHGSAWQWTPQCEAAFVQTKKALLESDVLTHFDPALPIQLACDASPYGVGAVISHILPNGEERPIAFASRTLSHAESNYAQIEREALGIVFGVRKFHQYLFGRKFILLTDHRPLTTIFGPHTGIPSLAAGRMQRWALLLSAHHYVIKYRKADLHANADGLSRLPLPVDRAEPSRAGIFYFREVEEAPITAAQVKKHTRNDPVLAKLMDVVVNGGHSDLPELKPYLTRRNELSVQAGCVLWGRRVIIPPGLQRKLLQQLHEGHCGMVRMKELARSYFWWPGLDGQIEETVRACTSCQQVRCMPQPAPLHLWDWPEAPWQCVHVDFAGPLEKGCSWWW